MQDYQLYQSVVSGQKSLEDLTEDEKRRVFIIHSVLSNSTDNENSDCQNAKEEAESTRNDLIGYTKKLKSCLEYSDLTDDCYSEFRRVKSYHSDYESAVSEVQSYCN